MVNSLGVQVVASNVVGVEVTVALKRARVLVVVTEPAVRDVGSGHLEHCASTVSFSGEQILKGTCASAQM